MMAIRGRKAVPDRRSGASDMKSVQKVGFTLLEVAIAGAILMGGLAILAQLVRTTLSSSTPGFTEGAQAGPVVEQQMRLLGAYAKSYFRARADDSALQKFGAVYINTRGATRSFILPVTAGYAGQSYALTEQEITAKLTLTSDATTSANDPVVGFTRFWKLEVSNGTVRTGL